MIVDYFKYDLYRKYQTSDGVTYTPSDEYQCVMTDYQYNDNCGVVYYGELYYNGVKQVSMPDGTKYRSFKIANGDDYLSKIIDNKNYNGEGGGKLFPGPSYRYNYYGPIDYELIGLQNSNINDMSNAFYGCINLCGVDLNKWDMSSVNNISGMFFGCPLSSYVRINEWDTSLITNMSSTFNGCVGMESIDISKWNTNNVTDMNSMFYNCKSLTSLNLSNFNTSKVTDLGFMFYGCSGLTNLDLSSFDTSNVVNISNMFDYCTNLQNINLSNWNCKKLDNMGYLFKDLNVNTINLTNFDSSNVTTMRDMFYNDTNLVSLIGIENLNVKKVENLSDLFNNCKSLLNVDLSGWETPNLTSLYRAFAYSSLKTIYIDKMNLRNADLTNMFYDSFPSRIRCTRLSMYCLYKRSETSRLKYTQLYNGTIGTVGSDANWEITDYKDNVIDATFEIETEGSYVIANNYIFFDKIIINGETDISFFNNYNITYDFPSTNTYNIKYHTYGNIGDTENMFNSCKFATSIDLSNWDTSEIKNMSGMFYNCLNLTSLNLNKFVTTIPTNMNNMFNNCRSLPSLDLSKFDTSQVTDMNGMFYNCYRLTNLNLSNFNTSKVTDMNSMFNGCSELISLDISNFNTSQVTNMSEMFSNCRSLPSLDLSTFDTSNVTDMAFMFNNCNKLTHIKCKQAFKDWCITNQDAIKLPNAMREGGGGTWEIVP